MNIQKLITPGRTANGIVFLEIRYDGLELSICGVEGPSEHGDARGAWGQIRDSLPEITEYFNGWNAHKVALLGALWQQFGMNTMTAGSPMQEVALATFEKEISWGSRSNYFETVNRILSQLGLNPDASYTHNGKPYFYGSAWLLTSVPEGVLVWLNCLPETTVRYPWQRKNS